MVMPKTAATALDVLRSSPSWVGSKLPFSLIFVNISEKCVLSG